MKIPAEILKEILSWDNKVLRMYLVEIMGDLFHLKEKNIHEYHKIKKKKIGVK